MLTDQRPIVNYAKWLITCLFILIEMAPILLKMMTERGPYDDILDRIKEEIKIQQEIKLNESKLLLSNKNAEINTAVKINTKNNEEKLTAELAANKTLLESIANAQAEIAQVAIKEWKEEQKKKVKENPSLIIKS